MSLILKFLFEAKVSLFQIYWRECSKVITEWWCPMAQVQRWLPSLTSHKTLGKLCRICVLQIPHLWDGVINSILTSWMAWGLNAAMHVECFALRISRY
jgi:hypothetical protein